MINSDLSDADVYWNPEAKLEFCLSPPPLEAFIRNFSAPYRLLQRHLVGEEDRRGRTGDDRPPEQPQHAPPLPGPLITEVTTSSFLPHVMDVQKVRKDSASRGLPRCTKRSERVFFSRMFCSSTTPSGVDSARPSTTSSSSWPDYCGGTAPSPWPGAAFEDSTV